MWVVSQGSARKQVQKEKKRERERDRWRENRKMGKLRKEKWEKIGGEICIYIYIYKGGVGWETRGKRNKKKG